MPKPGPRPYECVRKSWHSDKHQPIRGSLIQEIFRIVNEVHGSATKKNHEWQEKLPIVVFRAEEIMYSKANSEAEYMDVKTLWDRLNEAIDTIIRRDDSTGSESSDLLLPCIEAALHLGCSPKRLTRSQRNSSPRYFESNSVPTGNSHDRIRENPNVNSSFMCQDLKFMSSTVRNSGPSGLESKRPFSFLALKCPPSVGTQNYPMQTVRASPNSCSMYPLYYGFPFEPSDPKYGYRTDTDAPFNGSNETSRVDSEDVTKNKTVVDCDLSLRLGSFEVPCIENTLPEENKADDTWKLNDLPPQFDRGLSFFSKANADKNQVESGKMSSNGRDLSVVQKRKLIEDQQLYWPVKLPFNKFRS